MVKIDLTQISDDQKFKDLALLFDNLEFQQDLERLQDIIKDDHKKYPDLANYLLRSRGLNEAWSLTRKYKYPRGFGRAIFSAANLNKVTDDDVIHCYARALIHPLSELDEYTTTMTKDDLVIWVEPTSIKGKREAILHDIGLILEGSSYFSPPLPRNHPLSHKARSVIRQHRDWYWIHQLEGKGYKRLSQELKINLETLKSGIKAYEALLEYGV